MNQVLESALTAKPAVTGFLASDAEGLCITAKKDFRPQDAGKVVSIYNLAAELVDEDSSTPTIVIETDQGTDLLIKDYDSMIVAVSYKNGSK